MLDELGVNPADLDKAEIKDVSVHRQEVSFVLVMVAQEMDFSILSYPTLPRPWELQVLQANTQEAVAQGVFGVPTFVVGLSPRPGTGHHPLPFSALDD